MHSPHHPSLPASKPIFLLPYLLFHSNTTFIFVTFQNKLNDHAKVFHDESLVPRKGDSGSELATPGTNAKWMYWNADKTQSRSSEDNSAAARDIQGTVYFQYFLFWLLPRTVVMAVFTTTATYM